MAKSEFVPLEGYKVYEMYSMTQRPGIRSDDKLFTLLYVRKGRGMCLVDERLLSLNQGDILFFPSGLAYSFNSEELDGEYNESMDAVLLMFNELWLKRLSKVFSAYAPTALAIMESGQAVSIVGPKWLRISSLMDVLASCSPQKEVVAVLDILEQLADLSDAVAVSPAAVPREPGVPEKLARVEKYIECNFISGVVLEDIASYAGMNRTYFCLFFKKHFGKSLVDYVNERKIELACRHLAESEMSISEIAGVCGFRTVTYFNMVFSGIKGISPGAYRKGRHSR